VRPFRSERRYLGVGVVALALIAPGVVAPILASVITAESFIVDENNPIDEDAYVASTSGSVEGTIDGDLTIVTGDLTISGTVTGSVMALTAGTVRITSSGVIEGSLRTVSPSVEIEGAVMGDALVTGAGLTIHDGGSIGRDLIYFGGAFALDGEIGRDVRGRMLTAGVDGSLGRDLDIAVELLTIGSSAQIVGDVLYRSPNDAAISGSADIGGQVIALPAQSNFFYGVLLTVANIVTFLGFIITGLLAFWLFRATGEEAVTAIETSPLKSLLTGVGVVIAGPVAVVLLGVTLIGLPVAALLLFALLLGLIVGPIPSVTVAADLVLRRRTGLFGAFVLGAVVFRGAIWGLSLAGIGALGALLFVVAHVWGIGGWVLGGWRVREARARERDVLPEGMLVEPERLPDGWRYPLAPTASAPVAARAEEEEEED
jgi:cytoskeletal protein CcmA (bactofilin family)